MKFTIVNHAKYLALSKTASGNNLKGIIPLKHMSFFFPSASLTEEMEVWYGNLEVTLFKLIDVLICFNISVCEKNNANN